MNKYERQRKKEEEGRIYLTFLVWCPEYGHEQDEAELMLDTNARTAAERWIRLCDIHFGGGHFADAVTVYVRREGKTTEYSVTATPPVYAATKAG